MLTDKLPSVSHAGSVQKNEGILNNSSFDAGVVELVDTPDLGSGGESRGGSSPSSRTNYNKEIIFGRFSFLILYLLKIIN